MHPVLLPISFEQQILPNTFEYTLNYLVDNELDLSIFLHKYKNDDGRHIYSQRLGIVEPVFGHIFEAIGIKRFSLRGKHKVDGQWKLMAMLHNLTKIHRFGVTG